MLTNWLKQKTKLLVLSGRKNGLLYGLLLTFMQATQALELLKSAEFEVEMHGLADVRYQISQAQAGEIEQGLGKFRLGGDNSLFRINETALALSARLGWDWQGALVLKQADKQKHPVDLTEAFLLYRPVSTSPWRIATRIGMFFPPISLENSGTAWSSPYTLSSSAINSWVGEELKVFGAELQTSYQTDQGDQLKLFAAGLGHNDTAGVMLAWRGWSLQDYEATLHDQLVLPVNTGIQSRFPLQADVTRPFVEVDDRPGYYAGLSIEQSKSRILRAMYYDNRGNPSALKNGQYSWHTRFWSLGFKADMPWDTTIISQGMSGQTQMGDRINGQFAVDNQFWSASVLLSKLVDDHRFSIRHDWFGVGENDYLLQDNNQENGHAWTANYNLIFAMHHQLNLEVSHIYSNRPSRQVLNQSARQEETLWQIAYRLFF